MKYKFGMNILYTILCITLYYITCFDIETRYVTSDDSTIVPSSDVINSVSKNTIKKSGVF